MLGMSVSSQARWLLQLKMCLASSSLYGDKLTIGPKAGWYNLPSYTFAFWMGRPGHNSQQRRYNGMQGVIFVSHSDILGA